MILGSGNVPDPNLIKHTEEQNDEESFTTDRCILACYHR